MISSSTVILIAASGQYQLQTMTYITIKAMTIAEVYLTALGHILLH
jgi:hypothetical protein